MTMPRSLLAREDRERLLHDRALDAAAGDRARDLARVVHGHGRARVARARALGADDARDRDPVPGGPPALDVVEHFLHAVLFRLRLTAAIDPRQLLERGERVALDELVNVRQGRGHSLGQRRVAGTRLERVDPHDPVGDPVEAGHLLGEHLGLAAVPAVGEDHDDRAAGHARGSPTRR